MLGFNDGNYHGMVDWLNTNHDVSDSSAKDVAGDRMTNFNNRLQILKLPAAMTVDNHICDPETGKITDLGDQTLPAGDFVYGFTLKSDAQLQDFMKETGLTRADLLLSNAYDKDGKVVPFVVTNRATCNNPLKPPMNHEVTTTSAGNSTTTIVRRTTTTNGVTTTVRETTTTRPTSSTSSTVVTSTSSTVHQKDPNANYLTGPGSTSPNGGQLSSGNPGSEGTIAPHTVDNSGGNGGSGGNGNVVETTTTFKAGGSTTTAVPPTTQPPTPAG